MLKRLFLFIYCLFLFSLAQAQGYKQLHQKAIVVDTHNDVTISIMQGLDIGKDLTGKTHSDLARFKAGGVDVQFFSVWCDESYDKGKAYRYANRQIDSLYAVINRNPDKMMLVKTPAELEQALKQNKLASLIGVEGGHMIEDNLENLDNLFKRGARYLTLTWNNSTAWASSAQDESKNSVAANKKGLSPFGKQVVKRMNQLGMMVDVSHVGEKTFWNVINTTTKPVLLSHSNVYQLCPHYRNLKDDQIKAVAKNGGVIQLNFFSEFLDKNFKKRQKEFRAKHKSEVNQLQKRGFTRIQIKEKMQKKYKSDIEALRPPLSVLLNHLDYIVKLVGVDYVGLGSDFDGVTSTPQELDGVQDFPVITRELLTRGYTEKDIQKILGGNLIRVFRANIKS